MAIVNGLLLITVSLLFSAEAMPTDFFVNPKGNDQWSGTTKLPDPQVKHGPFKTLERAKQAIKTLKQHDAFNDKVTVHIAAGHYYLSQPLRFDLLDSGLPGREITWQGETGGEIVISGGIPVTCKNLDDKLWECPLKQMPVNKDFFDRGRIKGNAPKFDVFVNDQKLELARWPDQGWAHIKIPVDKDQQFTVFESLPAFKGDIKNAQVHIFPGNDWYDQYIGIESLNSETKIIKLSDKTTYPLASGRSFYIRNIQSALDKPGEWFFDQQNFRVLLIPPKDSAPQQVILSSLTNVIAIDGANYLKFENLTIQHSAGTGVLAKNVSHINMERLHVSNIGGKGIEILGSQQVSLSNSKIHHIGADAVTMNGGDFKTLQFSGNIINNNHIDHMGTVKLTSSPGIHVAGVGTKVTHNLLEQGAGMGLLIEGNEHLIEKNELHHFCLQSSDCGAIYSGRHWNWRGNVIRSNYIHDIIGYGLDKVDLANNVVKYRSPADARGVYLDDGASGFEIVGNIFENAGRIAVSVGGGRNNTIQNNYFKTSEYAIMVDDRGPNYEWSQNLKFLDESPYKSTIWREKYPELAIPMRNFKWPEGNRIERNIIVSTKPTGLVLRYFIPVGSTIIKNNLVWGVAGAINIDYKLLEQQKRVTVPWNEWLVVGIEKDSIYADPCVTVTDNKLSTCPASPIKAIGFSPIADDIGLIN